MYGARYVGKFDGGAVPLAEFTVKASEVIAKGDFLSFDDSTGKVDVAGAGEPILGVANETVTGNAGGTSKVEVILALPGTKWVIDNDNDTNTFGAADVGEWHDITGTTGAQLIDTSTGAAAPDSNSSQWLCLEYNPQGYCGGILDSDTSIGLYTPGYTYFASQYVE